MFEWVTNFTTDDWNILLAPIGPASALITIIVFFLSIIAFFFPSFGKKVRQFMFKWIKYIIPSNAGGFSSFSHRYNKHVIFEHRIFNVHDLRTQSPFVLEFEKVFVELRIAYPENLQLVSVNPILPKELPDNPVILDFLKVNQKHHKDHNTRAFVIIGAPGCGKSALLQHIALTFARKQQSRYGLSAYIPLLLFLRQHVQAIVTEDLALADLAQTHFSSTKKYPNLNPPSGWFTKQLKKGKCIILLDGLDEVVDLEQRQQVSQWIDQQIISYPDCYFIITSRPQGYLTARIKQAHVLEVQTFDTEQVQRFVHAWYLENEVHSFGREDEGVRNKAKQEADDLLQRLQIKSALNKLTVNPLLLTMVVMVHRYRGQLPEQRVELYAEIHDGLLGDWRKARNIQDDTLTTAQKRVVLQPLAAQMMKDHLPNIHTNKAVQIIEKPLQRVGSTDSVENFFISLQASSGLLLEEESNVWCFTHLTFQEYLAAVYFSEQQTELNWNELVNDSWWHETLRLYAAQGNATQLAQACLDHDTVTTLELAVDLLEEARELDKSVREQLNDRLINDLGSNDPERRQLAAKVRLKQRFKSLHRIDARREIDLDYITCAEYQLFLDEKRTQNEYYQNEYYQPDHWTGDTFPQGTAQAPIRGIRAEDAKAFCEWLTHRQAGQIKYYHYRLPQHAEIMDYPPQTIAEHLSTWYQKNESYCFDWLKSTKEVYTKLLSAEISNIDAEISNIDFDNIHPIDNTNTIDLAYAYYHVYAHNRDRVLDNNVLDPILNSVLEPIAYRADKLNRADKVNRTGKLASDLDLALKRNLKRDIAFANDRARDIALALVRDFGFDPIVAMITENNFQRAIQLAQNMQAESNPTSQRVGTLLHELLVCATATTPLEVKQAWRKYMGTITKYILIASNEGEKNQHRSWWQQLLHRKTDHSKDKLALLNLYWWLQIITAREEGTLPAYEGIRIVREQKD